MSTYHLHIPRTSGVFIRDEIIKKSDENNFLGHTEKIPKSFIGFKNVSGHFATTPIKDMDNNFSVIRNPIDLTISYINYMRDCFYESISLPDLLEKYILEKTIMNFVDINCKFLTGHMDIDLYNKNLSDLKIVAESGWYIEGYSLDKNTCIDIINNNETNILIFEDIDLYSKVSNLYNTSHSGIKTNASSHFEQEEIDPYIDMLTELNSADIDLYNHFYQML